MTVTALPTASRAALRRIAALHEACADPARLRLLNLLAAGDLCVCDLTELTGMSQPFVSRHLARLRSAGLVLVERRGKFAYYALADLGEGLAAQRAATLAATLAAVSAAHPALARERKAAATAAARRLRLPCP